MIFQPILPSTSSTSLNTATEQTLLYTQYFRYAGHRDENGILAEEPNIDMYLLQRHFRSSRLPSGEQIRMGDIVPMDSITQPVELIPVYGKKMDPRFNSNSSLELATNFYLNNFDDKDFYHSLLTTYL